MTTVQFLDESSEIRSHYKDDSCLPRSSPRSSPYPTATPDPLRNHVCESAAPAAVLVAPTEGFTVLSLLNDDPPALQQSPSRTAAHNHPRSTDSYNQPALSTFVYQQPPGEPILWPLEHEQEAMLLQHYIENVALFVSSLHSAADPTDNPQV